MNFLKKRFFDEWPSENLSQKLTTKKKFAICFVSGVFPPDLEDLKLKMWKHFLFQDFVIPNSARHFYGILYKKVYPKLLI